MAVLWAWSPRRVLIAGKLNDVEAGGLVCVVRSVNGVATLYYVVRKPRPLIVYRTDELDVTPKDDASMVVDQYMLSRDYSIPASAGFGYFDSGPDTQLNYVSRYVLVGVPYWFLVVAFSIPPTARFLQFLRARKRDPDGCPTCGYNLTGNTSGTCPECGSAVPQLAGPEASVV
jgi:hypothetical protein